MLKKSMMNDICLKVSPEKVAVNNHIFLFPIQRAYRKVKSKPTIRLRYCSACTLCNSNPSKKFQLLFAESLISVPIRVRVFVKQIAHC